MEGEQMDSGSLTGQSSRPQIERTPFDPIEPPPAIQLWYCPACGQRITRDYGIEPARKKCNPRWHLAEAIRVRYVKADGDG